MKQRFIPRDKSKDLSTAKAIGPRQTEKDRLKKLIEKGKKK